MSLNTGTSEVDQFIFDTVNASLGSDTPTSFKPGSYRQYDVNVNVDVSPRVGCARRRWRSRYRLRNLVSNYLSCPYGLMKSALEVRPGVVYLLTEVS